VIVTVGSCRARIWLIHLDSKGGMISPLTTWMEGLIILNSEHYKIVMLMKESCNLDMV
jgi:hypothetical protein